MDNQRLFFTLILCMLVLLLWGEWQKDYGPQPQPTVTQQGAASAQRAADGSVPSADDTASLPVSGAGLTTGGRIEVRTDVFIAEIDTIGGDLRHVSLPRYPVSIDQPEQPITLLSDTDRLLFVAQSGLIGVEGVEAPNHHSQYSAEKPAYILEPGQDQLRVRLRWQGENGLQVDKIYTFNRGRYEIHVSHEIQNPTDKPWRGAVYRQLQHGAVPESSGQFGIYTYTGGVIYTPAEKYEKIDFEEMGSEPLKRDAIGGWAAMIQHYFLAAWVPGADEQNRFYSKQLQGPRYILGLKSDTFTVPAGESLTHDSSLVVGPKVQSRLEKIAPGLELTVDYGMLTVIAKPLFWLLDKIHAAVGNWGWAIVILTILIKLVFYKLSETSYKSMANMRKLQPKVQALRDRCGDDKQKLNQAMMELYRKEKINPLGGCLPILVQIPVFIALYWTLLESVELRQAPFILWIRDLSEQDPYYILPILMGASMFVQQRLNPTPPDPIQAKIMMGLPFVFTIFFLFFPAGLVLYWLVNNLLSIAQQWVITKRVEQGG